MGEQLLEAIQATFAGHGIASKRIDGVIRATDGLTVEPRVYKHATAGSTAQVQVDFAIESPRLKGIPFLDSFAGVGDSPENAEKNAFAKFLQGSFHVIAESLTTHDCAADQVEREEWSGAAHEWRVCTGPLSLLATRAGARIEGLPDFFAQLVGLFGETMEAGPHWMRVFLDALEGKHIGSELLVDGEIWTAGQQLLDEHPWILPAGYASFRHLLIALPNPP